jgi:hypothetical protein
LVRRSSLSYQGEQFGREGNMAVQEPDTGIASTIEIKLRL